MFSLFQGLAKALMQVLYQRDHQPPSGDRGKPWKALKVRHPTSAFLFCSSKTDFSGLYFRPSIRKEDTWTSLKAIGKVTVRNFQYPHKVFTSMNMNFLLFSYQTGSFIRWVKLLLGSWMKLCWLCFGFLNLFIFEQWTECFCGKFGVHASWPFATLN